MRTGSLMVLADARFKLPEDVKELSAKQLEHVVNECEAYEWFPASAERRFPCLPGGAACCFRASGDSVVVQGKGFPPPSKWDAFLPPVWRPGFDFARLSVELQAYRSPVDNDAWIRSKVEGKMKMQNMKADIPTLKLPSFPGVARITAQFRTKGSELAFSGKSRGRFRQRHYQCFRRMYPSAKGEELLRLGVTFGMPAAYDRVEYLGLGPWDNYRDRRTSCWKDIFRTSVDDMFLLIPGPRIWATAWKRTG
ncbi:MAG: hypothetical protein ACLRPT_00115 [Akkermansia muciniphila]